MARLLAWQKKRGGAVPLKEVQRKWSRTLNVDMILQEFGPTKIVLERSRGGERVIRVVDLSWADQWAVSYHVEFPHHRNSQSLRG